MITSYAKSAGTAQTDLRPRKKLPFGLISSDLAAAAVFLAIFIWLTLCSKYGVQNADESAYYTFSHRLFFGDAPIVHEWSMTALSFSFQYLPLRIFHALTGSMEGCILFMRYLFAAVKMLLFVYIYLNLRQYRFWGLLAAVVYTGFTPIGVRTVNYYNIAPNALMITALILLMRKEPKPVSVVFAGVLIACMVIAEPLSAVFYAIYSLLVLVAVLTRRKGKTLFSSAAGLTRGKTWILLTAGILIAAAVYLVFLLHGSSVGAIISAIPDLLTDSTFSPTGASALKLVKWEKITQVIRYSGLPAVILTALYILLSPAVRRFFPRFRRVFALIGSAVFAFATISFFIGCARNDRNIGVLFFKPIPISLFGLAWYFQTEKKDRRLLWFMLCGFLLSAAVDIPSQTMLGGGCIVCNIPAVLALRDLIAELRTEAQSETAPKRNGAPDPLTAVCAAIALTALIGGELCNFALMRPVQPVEYINHAAETADMTAQIERGPLKGVRTLPEIKAMADGAMNDMDQIISRTEGPVYVANFCPWFYLYMDLPYGVHSASFVADDSTDRLLRYWTKFPEKQPEYIYVPLFDCRTYFDEPGADATAVETIRFLQTVFRLDTERGEQGYLLQVRGRAD